MFLFPFQEIELHFAFYCKRKESSKLVVKFGILSIRFVEVIKRNVNTFETIFIITEMSIFFRDLYVSFYFKSIKVLQFLLFRSQLMTNFFRPFIRIPIQENV